MDWLTDNWGSLASAAGLLVTLMGLWIVYWQAKKARTSAEAAEAVAGEAKEFIRRSLTVGDLQQAIDLVQTIKPLHRDARWQVVVDRYQQLRSTLADVRARHPSLTDQQDEVIQGAITQIRVVEDEVDEAMAKDAQPENAPRFNAVLNNIQVVLETLRSTLQVR